MIKEAIGTGSSIEEAQALALTELAAPIGADVQIEVLEMPVKKTLGLFGGSKAKVRTYYEIKESPSKKTEPKRTKEKQKEKEKPIIAEEKIDHIPVDIESAPEQIKTAYNYLGTIIEGIGVGGTKIEISKAGEEFFFNIYCEDDYSIIIGRRGETLDSIQYLVRLVANRGKGENDYIKISLNIGDYRQRREETLKEIARKNANRVKKYGKNAVLDPMSPFERRIIHTEVSKIDGVTSHSVGADSERKVVITLEEGYKPSHTRDSGYSHDRGRNNRSNNNNRGRYQSRPQKTEYVPDAPKREPRSDFEGTSTYGKIK